MKILVFAVARSTALLMLPPMLAGTTAGTLLDRVFPQWCERVLTPLLEV